MGNWIDGLAASLAWRRQRRLAAMQTQLDNLSSAVRRLEAAHESLLVRIMNLPRPRKAPESSSPSLHTIEEKMTSSMAPTQSEDKNKGSALYDGSKNIRPIKPHAPA